MRTRSVAAIHSSLQGESAGLSSGRERASKPRAVRHVICLFIPALSGPSPTSISEEDIMIAEIRGPAFNETAMRVYREALTRLCECQVPFLVAGAYALQNYTGIARHTKDLDIFVRRDDSREVLDALESI